MAQKGVEKPENLKAYTQPATANDIIKFGNFDTEYTNLIDDAESIHYHKSLDFSNVGMPTNNTDPNGDATKRLRQFHQTRLYIMDYDGVMAHNRQQEKRNKTYLISANLPEQFSYSIGSEWTQPFQQFNNQSINGLIQLGGKEVLNKVTNSNIGEEFQSTNNRVATILAWNGSKPLSLTLDIPVIDDGHPNESTTGVGLRTNLVEALEFLGSLCLPKGGVGHLGFYQPPPSPYDFTYKGEKNTYSGKANNHARIMLQLGGMLLVDNIIVTKVDVNYPNTKTMIRHWYSKNSNTQVGDTGSSYLVPLLANVRISVTTSEALTAQTYSNMLWLKEQKDQGSFELSSKDIKEMKNLGKQAAKGFWDNAKELGSGFDNMFDEKKTP